MQSTWDRILLVGITAVYWGSYFSQVTAIPTRLTFELPDNEKMCFHHKFEGAKRYVLSYDVVKGGQFDIDMILTSPNGKILYKEMKKMHDEFAFESSFGEYKFCFSNEFSTISHKTVHFSLREEEQESLAAEAGDKSPKVHTLLENSIESIHRSNSKAVSFQTEYRVNEARGRYEAEILNDRVQWWSIGEALIILFSSLSQIVILKRFFSTKRETTRMGLTGDRM